MQSKIFLTRCLTKKSRVKLNIYGGKRRSAIGEIFFKVLIKKNQKIFSYIFNPIFLNGTLQPPHYEKGDYIDFDPMNMWHIQEHVLKMEKKSREILKGNKLYL